MGCDAWNVVGMASLRLVVEVVCTLLAKLYPAKDFTEVTREMPRDFQFRNPMPLRTAGSKSRCRQEQQNRSNGPVGKKKD